jgi:predicted transcriptional regulator
VSDASDTSLKKGTGARVTLRLSEGELAALRKVAEAREEDLTGIIREAISAYLGREQQQAEHQRLAAEVTASVRREADRVIERHEQTTRALIAALNERLAEKL